jgi:hypothetical protein
MLRRQPRPKVKRVSGRKEDGVLRRYPYGGIVVIAGVVLAIVAVALTLALNR